MMATISSSFYGQKTLLIEKIENLEKISWNWRGSLQRDQQWNSR